MHLKQVLQNTIYDVDLDRILQSIHVYLQELGMDEIRKRYERITVSIDMHLYLVHYHCGLKEECKLTTFPFLHYMKSWG